MDIKEQAKQDYLAGMKIKDIANKTGKSASTIRSWKSRYKWGDESITDNAPPESVATKRNKSATQHKNVATSYETQKAIEDLAESDLKEKQKAFAMEYVRLSNATQAYINVYDVAYKTALVAGPRLLGNVRVQQAIAELRKAKAKELSIGMFDLMEDLAKEARADIGDFVEFGQYTYDVLDDEGKQEYDANGQPVQIHSSWTQFKDKDKVDTSLIKNISMGKDGLHIELHDRDKARKQLLEYLKAADNSDEEIDQVALVDDIKEVSDEA
ncbi:terminase small subunit [Weissella minor]|uniref:terminase small subunit n=1 Tax=Weissella minor TaxID=1620 RepID=UPI001BB0BE31|nr:terminase small subunit [Weissella minor]MBS0949531.1 terminase small subunit [Weissella minor]